MNMETEDISLSVTTLIEKLITENQSVCCYQGEIINGRQFYTHVKNFADQLRENESLTWALFCDEAYLFVVAFFAAVLCNKRLLIIPNNQGETLDSISQYTDGFLSDVDVCDVDHSTNLSVIKVQLLELPKQNFSDDNIETLSVNYGRIDKELDISLYTSGSTGKAKQITKKLQHFFAEVQALEYMWGSQLGQSQVISTVSHQHIYGLLFRIFWPLCYGRLWHSSIIHYPEELQQYTQNAPLVMISSPAFLKRVDSDQEFLKQATSINSIFSSGGLLDETSSIALQRNLALSVIEVLGSTETGGVAYRQQSQHQAVPWTPLPGVNVALDEASGQLSIQSIYCYTPEWFVMGDLVEFVNDKHFHLLGRGDRIVKIEEKRLSLPEMEVWLCAHEYVIECHLVLLQQAYRDILGAVVVLSNQAKQLLVSHGRSTINKHLKGHLAAKFEAVTLPRKWRYGESIPVNSQGKIVIDQLQEIFDSIDKKNPENAQEFVNNTSDLLDSDNCNNDKHVEPINSFPVIKNLKQENQSLEITLFIPPELKYFDGHFPQAPVLPGVVQLHWVIYYAEKYFEIKIQSQKLEVLKFQQIIPPEIELNLRIGYNSKKDKLAFSYQSEAGRHSSGRIVLSQTIEEKNMIGESSEENTELAMSDNP